MTHEMQQPFVLVSYYRHGIAMERHLFYKENNAQDCYREIVKRHSLLPAYMANANQSFDLLRSQVIAKHGNVITYDYLISEDIPDSESGIPNIVN